MLIIKLFQLEEYVNFTVVNAARTGFGFDFNFVHIHCSPQVKSRNEKHRFFLQISKLLVVDPKKRLTASQALAHPFFKLKEEVSLFPVIIVLSYVI